MSGKFCIANSYVSATDGKRYTQQQRKMKGLCSYWKSGEWRCDTRSHQGQICSLHNVGHGRAKQSKFQDRLAASTVADASVYAWSASTDLDDHKRIVFCSKNGIPYSGNFSAERKKAIDALIAEQEGD